MRSNRLISILLTLVAALAAGCAPSDSETEFLARQATLRRQNQGLRELIAEAESGSLVPKDRFLVGIDERVLGELLRDQLPVETTLGKRLGVRLDRASVSLWNKFGDVTLDGEVYRSKTPQHRTRIRVHGGLGGISIDPATNQLDLRVAIDRIELLDTEGLAKVLGRGGRRFLAGTGRDLLQDALPTFHIPVAVVQDIHVPALEEGAIALDSLDVPLDMSVERVIAAGGKLWVTLDAKVGRVTGAEEGLGVEVRKKPKPKSRRSARGRDT